MKKIISELKKDGLVNCIKENRMKYKTIFILIITLYQLLFISNAFAQSNKYHLILIFSNLRPYLIASESIRDELVASGVTNDKIIIYSLKDNGIEGIAKYKSEEVEVIFMVGLKVAKAVIQKEFDVFGQYQKNLKIFLLLTDPVKYELVDSYESPSGRVTGITMDVSPLNRLRKIMQVLPNYSRVGIIHSVQTSEIVDAYKRAAPSTSLTLITEVIQSPDDIQRAYDKMKDVHKVEVLLWIEDAVVIGSPEARKFFIDHVDQLPVQIGLSESHVLKNRCLTAVSVDYQDQGIQAAKLYLKTKMASKLPPVEEPEQISIFWNGETAKNLKINLPSGIKVVKVE